MVALHRLRPHQYVCSFQRTKQCNTNKKATAKVSSKKMHLKYREVKKGMLMMMMMKVKSSNILRCDIQATFVGHKGMQRKSSADDFSAGRQRLFGSMSVAASIRGRMCEKRYIRWKRRTPVGTCDACRHDDELLPVNKRSPAKAVSWVKRRRRKRKKEKTKWHAHIIRRPDCVSLSK